MLENAKYVIENLTAVVKDKALALMRVLEAKDIVLELQNYESDQLQTRGADEAAAAVKSLRIAYVRSATPIRNYKTHFFSLFRSPIMANGI